MRSFARALIRNRSDEYLLVKHSHAPEGLWNLPGGKLDPGETPADAVVRETREEVGLHLVRISHAFDRYLRVGVELWRGHYYFALSVAGVATNREPEKLSDVQFVPFVDIPGLASHPGALWEAIASPAARTCPHAIFRPEVARRSNGNSALSNPPPAAW